VGNKTRDDRVRLVGERVIIDGGTACTLTEDDNARRIAAKTCNVISDPLDS
jgi:hypothetical protein